MTKKRVTKKNIAPEETFDDFSVASQSIDNSESESSRAESDEGPVTILEKAVMAIDSLSANRPEQRVAAMQSLLNIFRVNYLGLPSLPEKWNYYETLVSSLESSMRRGKPTESVVAIKCLSTFSVQLTAFENRCLAEQFKTLMETRINDSTESSPIRGACAASLSWLHFLSDSKDFPSIKRLMNSFENVFKASCLKGDGKPPSLQLPVVVLHRDCIHAWCLLFTILPISDAYDLALGAVNSFLSLLQSNILDVRLAAGDAVGLIYERIRSESNENFKGAYFLGLTEVLNQLANNSDKSTSKVDSKKQRSTFRDLLNFLLSHKVPFEQVIKLRSERLTIDSFCWAFIYESFCRLIAVGMNTHLLENQLIREVFDLGPPPVKVMRSQVLPGQNKKTRHYANQLSAKIRFQDRNKSRGKRAVLAQEES